MAGLAVDGVDKTDAFLDGTFSLEPEQMSGEQKARQLKKLIGMVVRHKDPNLKTLTEGLSYRSNNGGERIFDLGMQPPKDKTVILVTFTQPPVPRPRKHVRECASHEMPPHVPAPVTSEHLLLANIGLLNSAPGTLMLMTVEWEAFWAEPTDDECRPYTEPLNWRAVRKETHSVSVERLAELLSREITEPFKEDPLRQACYQLAYFDQRRLRMYEDKWKEEKRRSADFRATLSRMGIRC